MVFRIDERNLGSTRGARDCGEGGGTRVPAVHASGQKHPPHRRPPEQQPNEADDRAQYVLLNPLVQFDRWFAQASAGSRGRKIGIALYKLWHRDSRSARRST